MSFQIQACTPAAMYSFTENHTCDLISVLCPHRLPLSQPPITPWPVRSPGVTTALLLLLNGTEQHKPGRLS